MTDKIRPIIFTALMAGLIIGCAGAPAPTARSSPTIPATPAPTLPPTPTPRPTIGLVEVSTPAQAAALVFASDERWGRMTPLRSDMVGQSSWYETSRDADGFTVMITFGEGDCQAGCIDRHTWTYHVDFAGTVELVWESGADVGADPGAGGDGPAQITIDLTAGPTCPVETNPPDPNCAARAVANAEVKLFDASGTEVATKMSDAQGRVVFEVPAGAYYAQPQPVEGLMGTPEPQAFSVLGGDQAGLVFGYDTGIR